MPTAVTRTERHLLVDISRRSHGEQLTLSTYTFYEASITMTGTCMQTKQTQHTCNRCRLQCTVLARTTVQHQHADPEAVRGKGWSSLPRRNLRTPVTADLAKFCPPLPRCQAL